MIDPAGPPTISCARAVRDGGIHAIAALDAALATALAGLSPEQAQELKITFGSVMAELIEKIVNPAVHVFPELAPDEATWAAIVAEQARQLGMRCRQVTAGVTQASNDNG